MELNEYQKKAMETCMDTCYNLSYMLNNLMSEVGELAGKVAKAHRKGQIGYHKNGHVYPKCTLDEWTALQDGLVKEAGDVMWQLFGVCSAMGWSAEDVARVNLEKLAARKALGTIDGSGDGVTKDERNGR